MNKLAENLQEEIDQNKGVWDTANVVEGWRDGSLPGKGNEGVVLYAVRFAGALGDCIIVLGARPEHVTRRLVGSAEIARKVMEGIHCQ